MAARFICVKCKTPPQPVGLIRTGWCQNNCHRYDVVNPLCGDCHSCPNGWRVEEDEFLTKVINNLQKYQCQNNKNGCPEEFEPSELEAHKEHCLFRDVPCPYSYFQMKITKNC